MLKVPATVLSLALSASSCAAGSPLSNGKAFVKNVWNEVQSRSQDRALKKEDSKSDGLPSGPRLLSPSFDGLRRLEEDGDWDDDVMWDDDFALDNEQRACDSAFLACLPNDECVDCFANLEAQGVDWAGVTPETPCSTVVDVLTQANHCLSLKNNQNAFDVFCATFNSCVVWDDPYANNNGKSNGGNSTRLDCDTLTSCEWEGMHRSWIGDGICHEAVGGCYNSEVCGYDGGDCCEDTCVDDGRAFVECGHDGYFCRDPDSEDCDPALTKQCEGSADVIPTVECASDETLFRLVMYDSFGDGWDMTKLTITPSDNPSNVKFQGGLKDGSYGVEYLCLHKAATCYHIDVSGGVWGNEVSWEVKPYLEGSRAIADGGSPMSCQFSAGGAACDRTCNGKPDTGYDPTTDPDYKSYHDLYDCITEKCVVQVGNCYLDPSCQVCFEQDTPDYCFGIDSFNAVVDCTMCRCVDQGDSSFCDDKANPGQVIPADGGGSTGERPCSPSETLAGSSAVLAFSQCTEFDQVSMMVTDFDQNNFGALDSFEACSHSYSNDPNHGGHTALGCMQILANAISNPTVPGNTEAPTEAISRLAEILYHDAEDFCECAAQASDDCPLCPSFIHFKTLLYESIDACHALDEIDCDAWNEFYTPCKINLRAQFETVDFRVQEQCEYAANNCGGAGPFPAFRRLDCGREIPKSAWDFYNEYQQGCLQADSNGNTPIPPPPPPVDKPTAAPQVNPADNNNSGGTTPATPKPYVPPEGGGGKPYVPPESKPKKKSHFFRNFFILCLLGGAGYYYYKRRTDAFSFIRYRPMRNFGGGESEMYSGFAMESSTTFEPPSLPPTPTGVDYSYRPT